MKSWSQGDCWCGCFDVLTAPVFGDLRLRGKVKEPAVAGYWGLWATLPGVCWIFEVETGSLQWFAQFRVVRPIIFQQGVLCRMTLPQFFSQFLHIVIIIMALYLRPNRRQGWAFLPFQTKWRQGEHLIRHGKHGKHEHALYATHTESPRLPSLQGLGWRCGNVQSGSSRWSGLVSWWCKALLKRAADVEMERLTFPASRLKLPLLRRPALACPCLLRKRLYYIILSINLTYMWCTLFVFIVCLCYILLHDWSSWFISFVSQLLRCYWTCKEHFAAASVQVSAPNQCNINLHDTRFWGTDLWILASWQSFAWSIL